MNHFRHVRNAFARASWMAGVALWMTCGASFAQGQSGDAQIARADEAAPAGMQLDRAVIVMRHGVRAATDTRKMNASSAQPWPAFEVADGELTPHGYRAIVALGRWERDYFVHQGLLDRETCASAHDVFVWSSPASRTQATAHAWLDGVLPGCGVAVGHATQSQDTLFHADEAEADAADPHAAQEAQTAMLAAMGSPEAASRRYATDVASMARVVGAPRECVEQKGAQHCGLYAAPWGVKVAGNTAKLTGPAAVGAAMSETIRMQYADGWPLERIAFGHVHGRADVIGLMGLRSAKYAYTNHVPLIARRGGAPLLARVSQALNDDGRGESATRLLVLVGHDTNIAQLRTLLGFDWKLGDYRTNDAVPGGTLLFERFVRERDGAAFVRVSYIAQSLDQMRAVSALKGRDGPLKAVLRDGEGRTLMPLDAFNARVRNSS
ncbi:histidine-type phosphatase [Paraburkholderia sp. J67]|uniref:histidine-type phosphatase n=1 Tax=Paraburkholderia sp. J67 TaxID=2805435 RepID=UPI002ABD1683|nr:histidine-type phosphatase [Paraburkholderia sp. J67]